MVRCHVLALNDKKKNFDTRVQGHLFFGYCLKLLIKKVKKILKKNSR